MIKDLVILLIKKEIPLKKDEIINKFKIGLKTKADDFEYKVLKLDFSKDDVYDKINKCLVYLEQYYNIKYIVSLLYNSQLEINIGIYILNNFLNRYYNSTTPDYQEENALKYKSNTSITQNIYKDDPYLNLTSTIKPLDINLSNDYNSFHGFFVQTNRDNYIMKGPIVDPQNKYIWNGPSNSSNTYNLLINKKIDGLLVGENFLQSFAVFERKSQFLFFYDPATYTLSITDYHTQKKIKLKTGPFALLVGAAIPTNSLEIEGILDFDLYIAMGYRLFQHLQ